MVCMDPFEGEGQHIPLELGCGHSLCKCYVNSMQKRQCPLCTAYFGNGDELNPNYTIIEAVACCDSDSTITVNICTVNSKILPLKLNQSYTLGELKSKLSEMLGIPLKPIRLVLKGKVLRDEENSLKDYGVVNKDKLHLLVRYLGG